MSRLRKLKSNISRAVFQAGNEFQEFVRQNKWASTLVYSLIHPEMSVLNRAVWRLSKRLPTPVEWPEFRALSQLVSQGMPTGEGANGPRILFSNMMTGPVNSFYQGLIAKAVELRGARPAILVCDTELANTDQLGFHTKPKGLYQSRLSEFLGLETCSIAELLAQHDVASRLADVPITSVSALDGVQYVGVPVGRLVKTSLQWSVRRGRLLDDEATRQKYRVLIASAMVLVDVFNAVYDRERPDVLVLFNALLFTESLQAAIATQRGIPYLTYERSWFLDSLRFSWNKPAGFANMDEFWDDVRPTALTDTENQRLDGFLESRRAGKSSVAVFWPNIRRDRGKILSEMNLCGDKKLVTLFSNISWDSAVLNRDNIFDDLLAWVQQNVEFFRGRPEQLIVRAHPAEIRITGRRANEPVADVLRSLIPNMPDNVQILGPESPVSSYLLTELSHAVLVYTSTLGLEAALVGRTVFVGGVTHYAKKGFTIDPPSRAAHFEALEAHLAREEPSIDGDAVLLARRYANMLFYHGSLRFKHLGVSRLHRPLLQFSGLDELLPGRHVAMDTLCDTLLNQAPALF